MRSGERYGRLLTSVLEILSVALLSALSTTVRAGDEDDDDDEITRPAVRFEIPEVTARPGERVELPLTIDTDTGLSLAAFSLEYDASSIGLASPRIAPEVQSILDANPEADSLFTWFSGGTPDKGWIQVLLVMDFVARDDIVIPAGRVPAVHFELHVSADAPEGRYPLAFTRRETADYDGEFEDVEHDSVYNHVRDDDSEFDEETEFDDGDEPAFADGAIVVSIIGDVSVFGRGDANIDRKVDISDPVHVLDHLFVGGHPLDCEDAADANDDGTIDLSDAVDILSHLFDGTVTSSLISIIPAGDPTPDSLDCAFY